MGPHAYRLGRHLRIDRHDFNAWLQTHIDFTGGKVET
ncbi:MAG: helix-turn-helix domain-containing protein [Actinomycetota bacterium]|nr:helix-turn-helix domain-containing protein [Actinomycetota bacterium]